MGTRGLDQQDVAVTVAVKRPRRLAYQTVLAGQTWWSKAGDRPLLGGQSAWFDQAYLGRSSGQGRGRTADLPLFRTNITPVQADCVLLRSNSTCADGWIQLSTLPSRLPSEYGDLR
jgi:hypothetical protein